MPQPSQSKSSAKGIKPTSPNSKISKEKKVEEKNNSGIPKKVANRMARRIAFTTGLPTLSGMGVFIGSYVLISKNILDVPPALTLITSATLFFLGLVGLSYGILSASWDNNPGTILGIENIGPNITRMRASLKSNQKEPTKEAS
tara:strand:- start:39 stop:470 length:432 start_codon:yes stop_codon:yes gene_type:complete